LPPALEKERIRHCQKNLAGKTRRKLLGFGEDWKGMPVLLFGIGVFAFVAGLVMIGFGIPINEFSFGNTLISAGTTASIGGLVIIAVGIAVGQLRRIAEMLADPAQATGLARIALPAEDAELAAAMRKAPAVAPALAPAPAGGRTAFPPRPKADPFADEPEPIGRPLGAPMGAPMDERPDQSFAPSLRNPDEASLPLDDDISLSPRYPQGAPAPAAVPPGSLDRTSDSFDWRTPPAAPPPLRPQPANFDAMWPAEGKVEGKVAKSPPPGAPAGAPRGAPREALSPEPKADAIAREAFPAKRAEPEMPKPRTVAILKSGVVDGMGYTLYVDGSIEAELPQGTLRFASINELRSHLEKNS
jgi:hypothetical protein